jgi:hypothetical protein
MEVIGNVYEYKVINEIVRKKDEIDEKNMK